MNAIDLHTHSNKSDGSLSPSELVEKAKRKGLSAIALTDHDSIDGLDEAISHGIKIGIRVIPGIELSCDYNGRDIHIVGLMIDHKDKAFCEKLKSFADSRYERNIKMCQKLTDAGMPMSYEKMQLLYKRSIITRSHYARYMLKMGYTSSLSEAFERYIGDNCPYYVSREKVTPAQGIELIRAANGIPVLAHPLTYKLGKDALESLISSLKEAGLVAMEAIYCTHTPADERSMTALANKYNLLISGGSDFHGDAKPGLELGTGYGHLFIPETILTALEDYHL